MIAPPEQERWSSVEGRLSEPGEERAPSVIGRRLATGFGLVGITALAMCAMLLVLLGSVARTVGGMRDAEQTGRHSMALASAVREQHIQLAHTIIDANRSHLDQYDHWVEQVRAHAAALRSEMSSEDHADIDRVVADTRELDQLFRNELIPAAERGDREAVGRLHRQAEKISSRAAADADAVAMRAESKMAEHHGSATHATFAGLAVGLSCMLLVAGLSVIYTQRVRRSVLAPLEALTAAARRVGGGDFSQGVGEIGEGEFRAVARAHDRMIEELRVRQQRIVQGERMAVLGQLAAGVAHEINNPIGVIRGYIRTMSPSDRPEALAEELKILDDEAAACQRIAEDLLEYARAQDLALEPVALGELLEESVRRFMESGEAGAHLIEVEASACRLDADGRRVRQVILNLLRNATQSAPADTLIEVTGRVLPSGGYEICVLDRGPGIDVSDQRRIFEPFFSRRDAGSGLGLAVCQGIVHAHGGQISARSRAGGGAELCFTLPARPSDSEEVAR